MLCGWEGNRRSGVALAMRHRHIGIPTNGLNGLGQGDGHPTYAPLEYYGAFTFTLTITATQLRRIHNFAKSQRARGLQYTTAGNTTVFSNNVLTVLFLCSVSICSLD